MFYSSEQKEGDEARRPSEMAAFSTSALRLRLPPTLTLWRLAWRLTWRRRDGWRMADGGWRQRERGIVIVVVVPAGSGSGGDASGGGNDDGGGGGGGNDDGNAVRTAFRVRALRSSPQFRSVSVRSS